MSKNLLIIGDDGVGKTTLANTLVSLRPYTFLRVSLASYLRSDLSEKYPHLDFYSKPTPQDVRSLMISRADELKALNKDFFCLEILKIINSLPPSMYVIIDDCRFLNEYHFFRKWDFIPVGLYKRNPGVQPYSDTANNLACLSELSFLTKDFSPYEMATKILAHLDTLSLF